MENMKRKITIFIYLAITLCINARETNWNKGKIQALIDSNEDVFIAEFLSYKKTITDTRIIRYSDTEEKEFNDYIIQSKILIKEVLSGKLSKGDVIEYKWEDSDASECPHPKSSYDKSDLNILWYRQGSNPGEYEVIPPKYIDFVKKKKKLYNIIYWLSGILFFLILYKLKVKKKITIESTE